jgi:hypothetical protein
MDAIALGPVRTSFFSIGRAGTWVAGVPQGWAQVEAVVSNLDAAGYAALVMERSARAGSLDSLTVPLG